MPALLDFGKVVSALARGTPSGPEHGPTVSGFAQQHFVPPNPIIPQGELVSEFVHDLHLVPPNPIIPQGQLVSEFVHDLHEPTTTFTADAGWIV